MVLGGIIGFASSLALIWSFDLSTEQGCSVSFPLIFVMGCVGYIVSFLDNGS
jgi:hypothetical protein